MSKPKLPIDAYFSNQRKEGIPRVYVMNDDSSSSSNTQTRTPQRPIPHFRAISSSSSTNSSLATPSIFDEDTEEDENPTSPNSPFEGLEDPFPSPSAPAASGNAELEKPPHQRTIRHEKEVKRKGCAIPAGRIQINEETPTKQGRRQPRRSESSTKLENQEPSPKSSTNVFDTTTQREKSGPTSSRTSNQPREKVTSKGSKSKTAAPQSPKEARASSNNVQSPQFIRYGELVEGDRDLNMKIYRILKKRKRKPEKDINKSPKSLSGSGENEMDKGWVYIFASADQAPGYVKIGYSKDVEVRKQSWEECGLELKELDDEDENAFYHFKIVESLVHAELYNERRRYNCSSHKKYPRGHKEWFEIEESKALESVRRWRRWVVKQKPFDDEGMLTPGWSRRLEIIPLNIKDKWDDWTKPGTRESCRLFLEQSSANSVWRRFRNHILRKDQWFVFVGVIILFLLHIFHGFNGVAFGAVGLIAL